VDTAGRPLPVPDGDATQVATEVAADRTTAVVIHDAAVDPELVRSAVAATGLSLENERLHARVRAQLEELRRSRARLVAATDEERRRVERDLHDGAQQQLLALAMTLDRVRTRDDVPAGSDLRSALDEALDEARGSLEELRRLARGIYPPELTERGLRPALDSLADRCSLPVTVDVPYRRFPQQIEAVAYFVAAEALTNAVKHAHAQRAWLELAEQDGAVELHIRGGGVGGVPPPGSGLQGLRDRVEAVGGELHVRGVPERGTHVTASLPTHHD
jgi:signal transduction histidine kinase